MQVTCHFHATNISTMNVLVAATRLRRPQTIGRALTKNENGNVFGEFMIPIGNISEVVCHYWIQPPVRDEGKSFRADVVIVDSFGNEHIVKNVEFPYR